MFRPILISSLSGTAMLPSVEAMVIDLPDFEGPNSFEMSTFMVRMSPSSVISMFFIAKTFVEVREGGVGFSFRLPAYGMDGMKKKVCEE